MAACRQFRFGAFELDVTSGQLRKQGVPLKLRPQASKVLLLLVGRAGQLVSRDVLRQALWGENTHVEFDQALNACVRDVRAALSDEHSRPRYIVTVPGGGYRFIAPVDSSADARQSETRPHRTLWRIACAAAMIFVFGALWGYKAAGYGRHVPDQIAQAQIVRDVSDRRGVRFVSLTGGPLMKSAAPNPEADTLYRLGRRFLNRYSVEGAEHAIEVFELASAKDPGFALPFAGLADAYCRLALKRRQAPEEAYPKALRAAQRALDLDQSSAEAHLAMARVQMNYERNWAAAGREHRRAIEIDPKLAEAHLSYGHQLMYQSQWQSAREETRRAQELDPHSPRISNQLCAIAYGERDFEEAIHECRRAIELDPADSVPRLKLAAAYTQKRRYPEASRLLSEFKEDSAERQSDVAGYLYAVSGRRAEALSALNSLKLRYRPHQVARVYMGLGNRDQALEWLEKAYADHGNLANLSIDPVFEPLASDPRFQGLLRRVGLEN
jgi:DNA-binding winged helix-turn-helix (wHTH) protein/tetratricopeptide (TPR) repeat protein